MSNSRLKIESKIHESSAPPNSAPALTSRDLITELARAEARIKELEAQAKARPITVRTMKADIARAIGAQLTGGDYTYSCTVSRSDLEKIHAWVMARSGS